MIIPSSIAFLYQEIPKLGTDGGLMLNEPLIEICGRLKCGSDQEKFMIPLILEIAPDTTDLQPSQMLEKRLLMLLSLPLTVE